MKIAPYIDHTSLKANVTIDQISTLCREALKHQFAAVCINPTWVEYCRLVLGYTKIKICSVVGFPLGATLPSIKALEAARAFELGASEIDMVINIGALKDGDLWRIENEIKAVRQAVPQAVLKIIIETCLLNRAEKTIACSIAQNAGADFVKTSTGFSTSGATIEDVALLRGLVGPNMGVKAAGGIKDFKTAKAMIEAGANRLGCSAGVAIVEEEKQSRVH